MPGLRGIKGNGRRDCEEPNILEVRRAGSEETRVRSYSVSPRFNGETRAQFPRLLDVEKWWAVVLVNFTGLDPMNAWSTSVAAAKLDEVLRPAVLVGASRKDLPRRARLPLQQIISEWDYLRQRMLVKQATAQLLILRMKMPPEMVALVDEYRSVLESYLKRRDQAGAGRALSGVPATRADLLVHEVVKKLNDLDQVRAAFGQPKSSDPNPLPGGRLTGGGPKI